MTALPVQDEEPIPDEQIDRLRHAAEVIGLELTDAELALMAAGVFENREGYARTRAIELPNSVAPALGFASFLDAVSGAHPLPAPPPAVERRLPEVQRPAELEELAFADIATWAALIHSRAVSCLELTDMYLARLERLDAELHCVITLLSARARDQARALDEELAAGEWRGLLHGIPWGAKDLLAARGAPTTWGAKPFEGRELDLDATVVTRLDEAGAVLIAKLSLGALAWGDVWYGERTRNPWNPEQGSSGSSAGPAAATAAGGVVFAIGSETYGSIVSPSVRCGNSSLRPTYGRVSRHGAMALSWSMDKLGPMCRSVADAAIVMSAIEGLDPLDDELLERPFADLGPADVTGFRVGYVAGAWGEGNREQEVLFSLKALGTEVLAVELPEYPMSDLIIVLNAEAAAAFDELTRSGRDDELVRQERFAWPNAFREARLIPAVEYIQANRIRRPMVRDWARLFDEVDILVHPSQHRMILGATNLTGHPSIVVPTAIGENGRPGSLSFTAQLFDESRLLAFAEAWQRMTGYHHEHPPE
jgi:Asp-tRNA(Asn)/Glu-tRNA(Gln) amidotransferase A subunit family amidase